MVLSSKDVTSLIDSSIEAKTFSYSPYSKFRVGCAVRTTCGRVFQGCNVENASYGLTICAERTALVKAISEGYKTFDAVVVATDVETGFTYPCGACRQFIAEFGEVDIVVANGEKQYKTTKISTILPYSFVKSDLLPEERGITNKSNKGSVKEG